MLSSLHLACRPADIQPFLLLPHVAVLVREMADAPGAVCQHAACDGRGTWQTEHVKGNGLWRGMWVREVVLSPLDVPKHQIYGWEDEASDCV